MYMKIRVEKFMCNESGRIKLMIIDISGVEFDSHKFIQWFMIKFQNEYVSFLNPNHKYPFRSINSQIARTLSKFAALFGIEDTKKTDSSINILDRKSKVEVWRKKI